MHSVFEQIKDRLPITDVLATYITLIPSGSQYKAKCPFHNERSASFSVSPDRGLYYCFGCGAKGDIFTFVEQFEGVDRKGALRILADRAGVVLTNNFVQRESTDPLYDILESTATRYQHELARQPEIIKYLHDRGITDATIANFRIGYAPDEWRFVANSVADEKEAAIAERAGLVKKTDPASAKATAGKESRYYDRFRKRVMFPLTDASGRIVGFSGRLYPQDEAGDKQSPKYINSPETELFQKSRILFGFDKAKAAIRQYNFATLVEGQMDCVLAHQAGFKNTVATSGTAVSDTAASDGTSNLSVLARLTPHVFLAFDGDAAGQKALDHAAIVALRLGMNPKVVPLPEGVDPADYIKAHGTDGWKSLLKESSHFILHQLRAFDRAHLSPHVLVQKLRTRVFPFLASVVSPIEQSSYLESIAKELELSKADLVQEFERYRASVQTTSIAKEENVSSNAPITPAERFVALIQRYPSPKVAALLEKLRTLSFEDHVYTLPEIAPERMVILLATVEQEYSTLGEDERELLITECAHKLEAHFFDDLRLHYSRALAAAERSTDEAQAEAIMSKLQSLNKRRHTDG